MDIEGASRAPLTRHRRRVRIATGSLAATVGAAWVVAPPDDPLGISAFVGVTAAAIMVLLVFLFAMNGAAIVLRRMFERRW